MVTYEEIKLEMDNVNYPKYVCDKYISLRRQKNLFSQTFERDIELEAFCLEIKRLGLEERVKTILRRKINAFLSLECYEEALESKGVLENVHRDFVDMN